ncbi:MAG TPA: hypothetical protein VI248_22595 [Kineosporiaceae bacterium]
MTVPPRLLLLGGAVAVAGSLPGWLPTAVISLRERVFARVNGTEGLEAPGPEVTAEEFKQVYGHHAANGRSQGAGLSDLFWYWLAPGPQMHQEHLEPGPRYDEAARVTRQILAALTKPQWEELVARCTRQTLDEFDARGGGGGGVRRVRLRDLMMPIWAAVYYEVIFKNPCPPDARDLIVGHAEDVINALKCTSLRHLDRRNRLTEYLRERFSTAPPPIPLPSLMSPQEQVYFIQGGFFNTAVVQMSEAMTHLLLALATHPAEQERLVADGESGELLDRMINETLLHFPLFGVAHRITSAPIPRQRGEPIPAGSVLLFNYADYQTSGLAGRTAFDPDRWLSPETSPSRFIPFGVTTNRPCPARGFAVLTAAVAAQEVLRRYVLESSAEHTRSLPNRGPCWLVPRSRPGASGGALGRRARLARMRLADRWEAIPRSVVQLVLGSYMVWDARRQGLCRTYFAIPPDRSGTPGAQPSKGSLE